MIPHSPRRLAASVRLEPINAVTRLAYCAARDLPAASIGKGWVYQLRATAAFPDGRVHSSTLSVELR